MWAEWGRTTPIGDEKCYELRGTRSKFSALSFFSFFTKSDAQSCLSLFFLFFLFLSRSEAQQLARRKHLSVVAHAYPSGKKPVFRDSQIFGNRDSRLADIKFCEDVRKFTLYIIKYYVLYINMLYIYSINIQKLEFKFIYNIRKLKYKICKHIRKILN